MFYVDTARSRFIFLNLVEYPRRMDSFTEDVLKTTNKKMKKKYPVSTKSRDETGWHKHLRKRGKRLANKSTRKIYKNENKNDI